MDVACQDMVQVEVFSDELLELFDDGHFNAGERGCGTGYGTGRWFWGFTWAIEDGLYRRFECLGTFFIFLVLGVWVLCSVAMARATCFEKYAIT